ncbi:MAG: hypothetical protein HWQ38_37945 [Nostoc sp. NMS7]|uniref:hypothetical protein n=1 Tax=Nostoc sp. NMS7 TaxID=2815391 RepID=UPI0025FC1999|nr:hypothetical protein [Nostoc sp. NMS7]MBN3951941.1 hypothetical protein [Nostoc sp. NMS7]
MRQLTLSISGISVTLKRFVSYDRTLADTGQTEYSISGASLDSGPVYEPKHIWTVSASVTLSQWWAIGAIFGECDRLRRTQGNYNIIVDDSIQDFIEQGYRSRGLAIGGVQAYFPGGVAYSARFYARMLEPKSRDQANGVYPYVASFVLRELDKAT